MKAVWEQGLTGGSYSRHGDHLPEGSAMGHLLQKACLASIPPTKPPSCHHLHFGFCLLQCYLSNGYSSAWLASENSWH